MIKAAVIGMGRFGQHHARIYQQMPDVELAASCDLQMVCGTHDAVMAHRWYMCYERMLDEEKPDIVSVAVPTDSHFEVVLGCLARNVDVLVEKPLAATIQQAEALVRLARETNVVLAVGHVERFNPVVRAIKALVDHTGPVEYIETHRSGPKPTHRESDGVALELAIHDVDVIRHLVGDVQLLSSCAVQDGFQGSYTVPQNGKAMVYAKHRLFTPEPRRTISVRLADDNWLFGDYLQRGLSSVFQGCDETILLHDYEPLRLELEEFVTVARGGEPKALAMAEDGLAAMRLV